MSEDFPTLERPIKATSGWEAGGRVAMLTAPNVCMYVCMYVFM